MKKRFDRHKDGTIKARILGVVQERRYQDAVGVS
jgi:hypothetical protein